MTDSREPVIVGVDTHDQNHVAVLLDRLGRRLGKIEIPAERAGYQKLLSWCCAQGPLESAGVEGTGSYGAGLARFLSDQGVEVFEVRRPKRQYKGKSDSIDAEAAARSVLAKESTGLPKHKTGIVESIRILRLLRSSAVKARTQTGNQMRALVVSAPEEVRKLLRPFKSLDRIQRCARFRPNKDWRPETVLKKALRALARRWLQLDAEARERERELSCLIQAAAPRLLSQPGIGPESAAKLLVLAGDNGDRLRSDAALAALCGASPLEASSGKRKRHRLNRGGDRQGNNALWTIAMNRLHHHPETRAYARRRRTEGLSDKEILRCLKRYLARRLYPLLLADLNNANSLLLT